ncbi:type II secretion system secretin GspD [Pseudomonadales bacterium]|nr:type II secretion system secretin GspD [Pseudomonadales bacterium]MDB9866364.1 type II secretion system secretin GspD [Pseudomonadales bacterium]MDB9916415.1 type II secretion system secretin GspD [Pseudomonadales bacterium]
MGHRLILRITLVSTSLLLLLVMSLPAASQDNWKINLKNADIREFVTQVSAITGKSFIIDPRVKGNVTVISNTSMDTPAVYELFLAVLRVHGFAAVPSGQVVRIVQQVLAKQSSNPQDFSTENPGEELVTQVLSVKNTDSNELVKILRPLIPQYGHIAGLSEPNALIISDHAENIARLTEIINRIDIADNSTTRIIQLQNAWIEDVVSLLEQLAPEQMGKGAKGPNRVTVVASERTNSLIIKGEPETLDKVVRLVSELDVPANRGGTIQVVRLAHSDAVQLAEILKNLVADKSQNDSASQAIATSIQADESLNALVIRADPATMAELKEIIARLDIRRLQVLIEAAIVEVTSDFTRTLGTELAVGDVSGSALPIGLTAPSGTLANVLANLAAGDGQLSSVPDLGSTPLLAAAKSSSGVNFGIIVRALSANSDVNLLSTPSITTMDNEQAKIVVGQNVPFRTGSTTSGSNGASNPFTTIQREDVGLTLEVTPHIHDGNLVRLEIHQEVSEVDKTSLASIGSDGSADLITNKRTIDTTVLADDREVIILGGLIRDKITDVSSGVPLLKDIPILGRLFKSSNKIREKQNLLVFLRPTVLATKEDVKDMSKRKYSGIWEVQIEGRDPLDAISDLFDGKR